MDSLQRSGFEQWWDSHTNVLVWVLSMASHGAFEDGEKAIFELRFRRLIRHMGLLSFESLQEVLKQQLWRNSVLDQPLKNAWLTATTEDQPEYM